MTLALILPVATTTIEKIFLAMNFVKKMFVKSVERSIIE